jgi:monofunctional biosynthetic peptidoglycan transglycosylase
MLSKKSLIAGLVLIGSYSVLLWLLVHSLPDVRPLNDSHYNMTLTVRDENGKQIPFILGPRNPGWTPLSEIPPDLQRAVVVAEDDTFYHHHGFNVAAIRDALWENIKRRRPVRGGSTITQQLAKNLYLSKKKSLERKLKEAVIAWKLERHLDKDRILELYLNIIEWGPEVYGVEEAGWYYFRKFPADLDFFESVLLAAIIPSPKRYDPLRYPERALERYKTVLSLMLTSKLITADQYVIACAVQLYVDPLDHTLYIGPLWEEEKEGERGEQESMTSGSMSHVISGNKPEAGLHPRKNPLAADVW